MVTTLALLKSWKPVPEDKIKRDVKNAMTTLLDDFRVEIEAVDRDDLKAALDENGQAGSVLDRYSHDKYQDFLTYLYGAYNEISRRVTITAMGEVKNKPPSIGTHSLEEVCSFCGFDLEAKDGDVREIERLYHGNWEHSNSFDLILGYCTAIRVRLSFKVTDAILEYNVVDYTDLVEMDRFLQLIIDELDKTVADIVYRKMGDDGPSTAVSFKKMAIKMDNGSKEE